MKRFNARSPLFRMLVFVAVCLLALPGLNALATQPGEEPAETPMIHLQYASFDPLKGEPSVPAELQANAGADAAGGASRMRILQFTGPVQEDWKAAVEAAGGRLYGYIPNYAFLARLDGPAAEAARSLPFVRWVGDYYPAYRLSDLLRSGAVPLTSEPLELSVLTLPDANLDAIASAAQALGGSASQLSADEITGYMRITVPASQAIALAALDGVVWVEPYQPQQLFNDKGVEVMNVFGVRSRQGLYGSGQVVAVADTGLDVGTTDAQMSDDFEGRIASGQSICASMGYRSTWSDFHGHGTHVAGSVLSNGRLSGSNPAGHQYNTSFAGAAPEAQLIFQSIDDPSTQYLECIPVNLKDFLFKQAYDVGARIHTNSWGGLTANGNYYGGYDAQSQAADNAAWFYKNMLILYAAGNFGTDDNSNGVVDNDSLGSPATAKNVLTVGATENNRPTIPDTWGSGWPFNYPVDPINSDPLSNNKEGMAAFSSRGPADDGRVKPDIVAPGTFILSARSHDPAVEDWNYWDTYDEDYAYMGGTSMATPLTAGAASLAREWLVEKRGFANPSAALMKAVLLNGATNITPGQYGTGPSREIPDTVPNSVSGWGRVDVVEGLSPNPPRQIWLQDNTTGLATSGQASYTIRVGGASAQGEPVAEYFSEVIDAPEQPAAETPEPEAQDTPEPPSAEQPDLEGRKVELTLGSANAGQAHPSVMTNPQAPLADVNLVLDDGSWEDAIGLNDDEAGVAYQFIWLNRFTPAADEFPFNLEQIQVLFDGSGGAYTGAAIDLVVYQDADGNPANGATVLRVIHEWVKADDGATWSVYDLPSPVAISGPGDVLIAVINRYVFDGITPPTYPALLDSNSDQGRSWVGFWVSEPPDPPILPPPPPEDGGAFGLISEAGFPGNWMIRGYGTTGSPPTPTPTSPPPSPTPTGQPPPVTGGPLRITLAWTDYPGEPAAAKALVNDLDLEVIAPNGTHYRGNSGLYTSGQCLRAGQWDACNNVEGVLIPNAVYGNYTIIVHGYNVAHGPQPFAVVASGDNLLQGDIRVFLPMLRR